MESLRLGTGSRSSYERLLFEILGGNPSDASSRLDESMCRRFFVKLDFDIDDDMWPDIFAEVCCREQDPDEGMSLKMMGPMLDDEEAGTALQTLELQELVSAELQRLAALRTGLRNDVVVNSRTDRPALLRALFDAFGPSFGGPTMNEAAARTFLQALDMEVDEEEEWPDIYAEVCCRGRDPEAGVSFAQFTEMMEDEDAGTSQTVAQLGKFCSKCGRPPSKTRSPGNRPYPVAHILPEKYHFKVEHQGQCICCSPCMTFVTPPCEGGWIWLR